MLSQNDIDMFEVESTYMHNSYAPEAQSSIHFPLGWTFFKGIEIFGLPLLRSM